MPHSAPRVSPHRQRSAPARQRHDQAGSQSQLVSLFSRLMGEQATFLAEIVGECERAAVDLETSVDDNVRYAAERRVAAVKVASVRQAVQRGAKRRDILRLLNDLTLTLAGD